MIKLLEVAACLLTGVVLSLSLAHALEHPGKMRLGKDDYAAVRTIYYPGFTIGGAAEPLAIITLALLLAVTPGGTTAFWLTTGALLAASAVQLVYWLRTAPVNKIWAQDFKLSPAAESFFGKPGSAPSGADWTSLRDRWEWSHIYRAALATVAFALIILRTAS